MKELRSYTPFLSLAMAFSERILDTRGLHFHVLEWTPMAVQETAPVCLLLHGFNQTAHTWDEVGPRLAAGVPCRVVAVDLRGHGDSSWALDGDYSYTTQAEDVLAVVDALHLSSAHVVVGMSMGAGVAIAYAHLNATRVCAVVLVDFTPRGLDKRALVALRESVLSSPHWSSFEDAVTDLWKQNPHRTYENIRSRLSHSLHQTKEGSWTWKMDPAVGAASSNRESLQGFLHELRCPLLLVHGDKSPLLSKEAAEDWLKDVHDGTVEHIPNAGHSVMGDNPTGFCGAVIPFLIHKLR